MFIENLKKDFKDILVHEQRAKQFYDHYIEQVDNEDIRKVLISIRDDEKDHIKLAEKLITIAERL
jgi:rubrerythrin